MTPVHPLFKSKLVVTSEGFEYNKVIKYQVELAVLSLGPAKYSSIGGCHE